MAAAGDDIFVLLFLITIVVASVALFVIHGYLLYQKKQKNDENKEKNDLELGSSVSNRVPFTDMRRNPNQSPVSVKLPRISSIEYLGRSTNLE